MLLTLAARLAAVPTPSPSPTSNVPEDAVTPGVWGFVTIAAIAVAVILLILDMISRWDFPDGEALLRQALRITPAIAALRDRCHAQGVPVVYANDNRGQWRSDFRFVVRQAQECAHAGARIARALAPAEDDYFVLKPKHSAFFATPFELLLDHLRVRRLVVVGVTSDQCVAATVADARMRDFEVLVPEDAVATITAVRNRRALTHFREVQRIATTAGAHLRLDRR